MFCIRSMHHFLIAVAMVAFGGADVTAREAPPPPLWELLNSADAIVLVHVDAIHHPPDQQKGGEAELGVLKSLKGAQKPGERFRVDIKGAMCPAPPSYAVGEQQLLLLRRDEERQKWMTRTAMTGQVRPATADDVARVAGALDALRRFQNETDPVRRKDIQIEHLLLRLDSPRIALGGSADYDLYQYTSPHYAERYQQQHAAADRGDEEAMAWLRGAGLPLSVGEDFSPGQRERLVAMLTEMERSGQVAASWARSLCKQASR